MVLPALLIKFFVGGATLITTLRYGTGLYFWREAEKLEKPAYTVVQKLSNGVEIRQYESYLIAETTVDCIGFRKPAAKGFSTCAGYIFGKNQSRKKDESSEKMAMTAPVRVQGGSGSSSSSSTMSAGGEKMAMTTPVRVQSSNEGDNSRRLSVFNYSNNRCKTKVSFVIGKKYSKQTAPKPLDNKIKIREVPAHTLAVRKFSGPPPNDNRVDVERKIITNELLKANLKPKKNTETFLYGYHDPFATPNILRRNEVALLMEGSAQI